MAPNIVPSLDSTSRNLQEFSTRRNQPPSATRTTEHQHRTVLEGNTPVPPDTAPALTNHSQNLLSPHTFLTARCKNEPWPEGSWCSPNPSFAALPFSLSSSQSHFKHSAFPEGEIGAGGHLCHLHSTTQNELSPQTPQVALLHGGLR